MKRSVRPIMHLGLATVLVVSAVSHALAQSNVGGLARHVEELVELAANARTLGDAEARFLELQRAAPADSRIPYLYAMLLIDRNRCRDACRPLHDALALDGKDLAAWKTRIWLSVLTGDCDDALATIQRLVQRMPARGASAESERKCDEFAGFVGQVLGYLAGPGNQRVDPVKLDSRRQAIQYGLPDERRNILHASCQAVIEDYEARMRQIDALGQQAQQRRIDRRNLELAALGEDRVYASSELSKIEDLRMESRVLASEERNMIAATRARARGAYARTDAARLPDRYAVTPLLLCKPRDPSAGSCGDLAYRGVESSGYVEEHGLGDGHYADVNRRERDYHEYLVARERNLHRRNRRIEKDTSQLLSRPVLGNAAEVTCLRKKATALATYVPLPISPEEQIGRILASYRNPDASFSVAALHTP